MKEVEVKIIEVNRNMVEAKMMPMGASETFDGDEVTAFFDFQAAPSQALKTCCDSEK